MIKNNGASQHMKYIYIYFSELRGFRGLTCLESTWNQRDPVYFLNAWHWFFCEWFICTQTYLFKEKLHIYILIQT